MESGFSRHRSFGVASVAFIGLFLVSLSLAHAQIAELPTVAPEKVGMDSGQLGKIDGLVSGWIASHKLAGATVAVARHGKVAYFKAFGQRDREASLPMTEDTIFRIYSMSKAFTSAAVLMLMEEGKIGLEDPVSKYIPEFKGIQVSGPDGTHPARREPTVHDLLHHTAGLGYGWGTTAIDKAYGQAKILNRDIDLQTMCASLGRIPLNYEPGTAWLYSVGIDVLGRIVEVASGLTFDVFLEKRIFHPLDLKDTGFFVPAEKVNRFAALYHYDKKGGLTLQDAPGTSEYLKKPRFLSGGGGLVSTTRDYLRFLSLIHNHGQLGGVQLLKPATVDLMNHNDLPASILPIGLFGKLHHGFGFGLGFNVRVEHSDKWDPASPVGEWGWAGIASTHYWASPKDDLIVVTMEQTMPFNFNLETGLKGVIYSAIREK
jgi:CubicO group peptidase (beta-lactamase class C family)